VTPPPPPTGTPLPHASPTSRRACRRPSQPAGQGPELGPHPAPWTPPTPDPSKIPLPLQTPAVATRPGALGPARPHFRPQHNSQIRRDSNRLERRRPRRAAGQRGRRRRRPPLGAAHGKGVRAAGPSGPRRGRVTGRPPACPEAPHGRLAGAPDARFTAPVHVALPTAAARARLRRGYAPCPRRGASRPCGGGGRGAACARAAPHARTAWGPPRGGRPGNPITDIFPWGRRTPDRPAHAIARRRAPPTQLSLRAARRPSPAAASHATAPVPRGRPQRGGGAGRGPSRPLNRQPPQRPPPWGARPAPCAAQPGPSSQQAPPPVYDQPSPAPARPSGPPRPRAPAALRSSRGRCEPAGRVRGARGAGRVFLYPPAH
jgi:hypothetical protein